MTNEDAFMVDNCDFTRTDSMGMRRQHSDVHGHGHGEMGWEENTAKIQLQHKAYFSYTFVFCSRELDSPVYRAPDVCYRYDGELTSSIF